MQFAEKPSVPDGLRLSNELLALVALAIYYIGCSSLLKYLEARSERNVVSLLAERADAAAAQPLRVGPSDRAIRLPDGTRVVWQRKDPADGRPEHRAGGQAPASGGSVPAAQKVQRRLAFRDGTHFLFSRYEVGSDYYLAVSVPVTGSAEETRRRYEQRYYVTMLLGIAPVWVVGFLGRQRRNQRLPLDYGTAPRQRLRDLWLLSSAVAFVLVATALTVRQLSDPDQAHFDLWTLYLVALLTGFWSDVSCTLLGLATASTIAILGSIEYCWPLYYGWTYLRDATDSLFIVWLVAISLTWLQHAMRNEKQALYSLTVTERTREQLQRSIEQLRHTEQLLRRENHLLDAIGQVAHIGGWYLDRKTMTPVWTAETYRLHDLQPGTPTSIEGAYAFYAGEARQQIEAAVEAGFREGRPWDLTLPFVTAKGREIWVRAIGRPEYDENGVIVALLGTFQDVTREYLENARLSVAAQLSMEGHWHLDLGTHQLWVSAALNRLIGHSDADSVLFAKRAATEASTRLVVDHPLCTAIENFGDIASLNTLFERDFQLRCRNDEWRWFRFRGAVVRDATGMPTAIGGTAMDVDDKVLAELALQDMRERFERAVDGTDDGLYEWEAGPTPMIWYSDRLLAMLGLSRDDPRSANVMQLLSADDQKRVFELLRQTPHDGLFSGDFRFTLPDGTDRWIRMRGRRQCAVDGSTIRISGSFQDIDHIKKTEEALRCASEAAQAAAAAKSLFLANMSHEIRTPMNGVVGMTDLLLTTTLDAQQLEYVRTIRSSADALLTIINDILDFSKIESNKIELETVEFDLRCRIEDTCHLLATQAHSKGLEIVIDIDPELPVHVRGDPTRLSQILMNLIGNAIKFTHQGHVFVAARVVERDSAFAHIQISVSDTGIGIDAETLDRLFRPFSQADSSITRRYGGTGLGLSIARRLAELMGGTLSVESEPGQGSTFHLRVALGVLGERSRETSGRLSGVRAVIVDPHDAARRALRSQLTGLGITVEESIDERVTEDAPSDAASRIVFVAERTATVETPSGSPSMHTRAIGGSYCVFRQHSRDHASAHGDRPSEELRLGKPLRFAELVAVLNRLIFAQQDAPTAEPTGLVAPPNADGSVLNVLLVDDTATNRLVARRMLEKIGCVVTEACDGSDAVEHANRQRFDLVLMDIQMPTMDGMEATRRIRGSATSANRQTYIVALTASALPDQLQMFTMSGMNATLTKPIQLAALQDLVVRLRASIPTRSQLTEPQVWRDGTRH